MVFGYFIIIAGTRNQQKVEIKNNNKVVRERAKNKPEILQVVQIHCQSVNVTTINKN